MEVARPAEADARAYRTTPRRFYFADGTVEVRQIENPPPRQWLVKRMDPMPRGAFGVCPTSVTYRTAAFHRQDYWYVDDFIGPHRLSDYHEITDGT